MAGLSAGLNLGLNLALIPRYQHVAAASTTAATKGIYTDLSAGGDAPRPTGALDPGGLAKAGLASAAMAAVLITLRDQSLGLLIPVGAAVYSWWGSSCGWCRQKTTDWSERPSPEGGEWWRRRSRKHEGRLDAWAGTLCN